jgi:hypothetical protein
LENAGIHPNDPVEAGCKGGSVNSPAQQLARTTTNKNKNNLKGAFANRGK